jgi:hypothetical protein
MSARLAIVAEPAAASVAGLEGSFPWGEAIVVARGEVPHAPAVVALRQAGAEAPPSGDRLAVIAPTGDDLWSRTAWPVRDELFELDPPDPAAPLLLVTSHEDLHAVLIEKLTGRGIRVRIERELSAETLAEAATVAFPPVWDDEPLPGARAEAVPAAVFAPLAARRPLIAPRARLTFGLLPGVDHLAASTDDDVVQYADALQRFPEAFALQVALGRVAAERERASVVYGRLVEELTAAPRSAGPRG